MIFSRLWAKLAWIVLLAKQCSRTVQTLLFTLKINK
uniref:Uncharacterized protein n=1 Tax=Heterorhabditis bacteriophora TaxID=37862 RepID=A0A1I7W9K6_HETBA